MGPLGYIAFVRGYAGLEVRNSVDRIAPNALQRAEIDGKGQPSLCSAIRNEIGQKQRLHLR